MNAAASRSRHLQVHATASSPTMSPTGTAHSPRDGTPKRDLASLWRGALREFAVVVLGVLAALAAQAWWEDRQEQQREAAYLHQLVADIRENNQRLDEAIATDSAAYQSITLAVRALHAPRPLPPGDSLAEWIARGGRASGFQPVTGTYRALLATGDLRLIGSDSLRAGLMSYFETLDHEAQRAYQLRGITFDVIEHMVRALPFTRGIFIGEMNTAGFDFERLRTDPEAWVALLKMQAVSRNRVDNLRSARDHTVELLDALETEPEVRARAPQTRPEGVGGDAEAGDSSLARR